MKILGIDTSSKFLNIALSEDRDIIREESYLLDRKHASQLVPKVMGLLKKSRVAITKIDAFIIGLGPGSFTGLRIGVSAIKGFGIATGKPCVGVASIDSIACNARENDKDIAPIIDAKRGQVYSAIYRRKGDLVVRLSDYMVLSIDNLFKKVKRDSVFLGDGVMLYRDEIANYIAEDLSAYPSEINLEKPISSGLCRPRDQVKSALSFCQKGHILLEQYWYPGAGNLIKLGISKIKKSKKNNMDRLMPLYMYPEDCQVRKL